jgi:hypothetical protein
MHGPLIQTNVEKELGDLGRRLEPAVELFTELAVDRAEAEAEFKYQYHRALLAASGTVAEREARAHLFAADAYRAWKIAEAQEKATQQLLIALRTQIESARTISANIRAQGG